MPRVPRLRWNDRSLLAKGLTVVAIPMTGMLLLGAAFWASAIQERHAAADLTQTFHEQDQLDVVYEDMLNIETGLRGYLLSGKPEFLEPYLDGTASITSDLDGLRALESDDPWEVQQLAKLRTLVARELLLLADLRGGSPSEVSPIQLDRSKDVMDEIRIIQGVLDTRESAQLIDRRQAHQAATRSSFIIIMIAVVLGLLGGLFAVLLFTRGIARRVGRNEENAQRLERGDPLLPPPDGLDEVGRSGRAFAIAVEIIAEREKRLLESSEQLQRSNADLQLMQEELRRLATVDELTGLYNLRGFIPLAEHQMKLCDRSATPAAVLFMDLDGLKRVNDVFGHDAGSALIVEAVEIIQEVLRTSDVVARYGGDEFCALLTGGDETVQAVTRRLLEVIAHRNASSTLPYDLSLSLGTAIYRPGGGETIEDLMRRADAVMYEQKAAKKAALVP
jgi:diguanylate cyclase (GGDEF)-like protein